MRATGKQPLYQVQVTTAEKRDILIGPAVNVRGVLEPLVETINLSVAAGKQRDWRDARIVCIDPVAREQEPDGATLQ